MDKTAAQTMVRSFKRQAERRYDADSGIEAVVNKLNFIGGRIFHRLNEPGLTEEATAYLKEEYNRTLPPFKPDQRIW